MKPHLRIYMQTTYGVLAYGAWLFIFLGADVLQPIGTAMRVLYFAIAAAVLMGLLPRSYLRRTVGWLGTRVRARSSWRYTVLGLALPAILLAVGIASAYTDIGLVSWSSSRMPQTYSIAGGWISLVFDAGMILIALIVLVLNLRVLARARRGERQA